MKKYIVNKLKTTNITVKNVIYNNSSDFSANKQNSKTHNLAEIEVWICRCNCVDETFP